MKLTQVKETVIDNATKLAIILQVAIRYIDKLNGSHLASPLLKGKVVQLELEIERWTKSLWQVDIDEKILTIYNRIIRDRTYVSKNEVKEIKKKLLIKYSEIDSIGMGIETLCDMFETQYDISHNLESLEKEKMNDFMEDYKNLLINYKIL
jgi:hypothetical protein